MRIEACIVCMNYSDFLAATIDSVISVVDELIIVTSPDDDDTIRLCKRRGLHFVKTTVHTRDGSAFNKSRAINYGLAHLDCTDWLLHLDADIWLPSHTKQTLMNAELDPESIYGIDRVNCTDYESWRAYIAHPDPEPQFEWSCLVKPPRGWKVGARINHIDYGGYVPIGFFQLWNAKGSGVTRYPIKKSGDAEHSDVLHALQWDRKHRHLLPEFYAVHLESGPGKMGVNWNGRKSPPFGPAPKNGPEGKSNPDKKTEPTKNYKT